MTHLLGGVASAVDVDSDAAETAAETCGSPGEVANEPQETTSPPYPNRPYPNHHPTLRLPSP